MTKAVFFDLYFTLVCYEPPQEELESRALRDFGIDVGPEVFRQPLLEANQFIYEEIAQRPLNQRSQEEKMGLYAQFQAIVLRGAGIEADEKLVSGMLGKMHGMKSKLVLFDDVAPALDELKERGLTLGLISNVDFDISSMLDELGLPAWLDVVVTSLDAGANKPRPEIFLEAIRRAGVPPSEAVYVGDQYRVDVVGANGAGLKGVLIDRYGYYENINDCLRIRSLTELSRYL